MSRGKIILFVHTYSQAHTHTHNKAETFDRMGKCFPLINSKLARRERHEGGENQGEELCVEQCGERVGLAR